MLISTMYTPSLINMKYGYGYDIRVHAIQSSILILYYDKLQDIKINDLSFGYHCAVTENLVKEFQVRNGLVANGKLTELTWNKVFTVLKHVKKCTLIESAPRRISIIVADDYIENEIINSSSNSNHEEDTEYNKGGQSTMIEDELNSGKISGGESFINYIKYNLPNGFDTSFFEHNGYNNLEGGKHFDELVYQYIVSGGSVYNNVSFGYNIGDGGEYWHEKYLTPNYAAGGNANRDYDYIYNLLSNSIYEGNVDLRPMTVSQSRNDIGNFMGSFSVSTNKPFFQPYSDPKFADTSINQIKKTKFDLTIVYGAKGTKARKIIDVIPIAVTQEMDASGEPIYDIYEFIAKDVIDGI